MEKVSFRIPREEKARLEQAVKDEPKFEDRSAAIRYAIREYLQAEGSE